MLVLNKLDADNVKFNDLVKIIQDTFGKACVLFNAPVKPGHDLSGVVSVLEPPAGPPAPPWSASVPLVPLPPTAPPLVPLVPLSPLAPEAPLAPYTSCIFSTWASMVAIPVAVSGLV